jgi:hypothetical protein
MSILLISLLAALLWVIAPKPLAKGYRVQGRFKDRAVTYDGTVIAELRLKGAHWHIENPVYSIAHQRVFYTRNGAIQGAVKTHRRWLETNGG